MDERSLTYFAVKSNDVASFDRRKLFSLKQTKKVKLHKTLFTFNLISIYKWNTCVQIWNSVTLRDDGDVMRQHCCSSVCCFLSPVLSCFMCELFTHAVRLIAQMISHWSLPSQYHIRPLGRIHTTDLSLLVGVFPASAAGEYIEL